MKKVLISIIFILIIILVLVAFKIIKSNEEKIEAKKYTDMKLLDIQDRLDIDDYIIFNDYISFKDKIGSNILVEDDFKESNYLVFEVVYDSCSESDLDLSYTLNEGNLIVHISYKAKCGLCAPEYLYYYIKLDKNVHINSFDIKSKQTNKIDCPTNVAYKPIIYLYPTTDMDVSIKLLNSSYLTTTYPKYSDGWNIFAYTDGKLIDKKTNREYYGLYWEGNNHYGKMEKDGFVVSGEETIEFLEEKLKILGLTDREANEFIIYWLPILEKNKYNYIRFETIEEINNYMPLYVEPKPDTIIRVLMDYKPLDEKIEVLEQQLKTPERYGFTVVEWGGSKIN